MYNMHLFSAKFWSEVEGASKTKEAAEWLPISRVMQVVWVCNVHKTSKIP